MGHHALSCGENAMEMVRQNAGKAGKVGSIGQRNVRSKILNDEVPRVSEANSQLGEHR